MASALALIRSKQASENRDIISWITEDSVVGYYFWLDPYDKLLVETEGIEGVITST